MKTVTLCASLICVALCGEVLAQHTESTLDLRAVIDSLEPAAKVRVLLLPTGTMLEGRQLGRTDSSLILDNKPDDRTIHLSSIEQLWVRGDARWQVTMVGAAVGLLLGAGIGYAIGSSIFDDGGWDSAHNEATAYGVVIGAGVGLAIGAIAGRTIADARRPWDLRYPPEMPSSAVGSTRGQGQFLAAFRSSSSSSLMHTNRPQAPGRRFSLDVMPDMGGGLRVTLGVKL